MDAHHSDMKGSIEFLYGGHSGPCRIYKAGLPGGYVSKNGGFTAKPSKAVVYPGAGHAIFYARLNGFAITTW